MAHANPIQIQKYLKGVDYPASKAELIENAKKLGADDNVCASLEQLPDEDFQTPAEVSQAFKGPSSDDVASAEAPAQPQAAPGANEFLVQVMEDSLAEIELCMLALQKSSNDDIKTFAQSMIDEHGRLGEEIEQLAQQMKVRLPKKLTPEHASMIDGMSALKAGQFDKRFVEKNLEYHENDLKVFKHYAAEEKEGPARKLAETGVRLFTKHLKMVKDLDKRIKG
jgi:predicted outer membrane protein